MLLGHRKLLCSSMMKFAVLGHRTSRITCLKMPSRKEHGFSPLTPLLYAESSYFTNTLQYAIEGIHSLGIPWVGTFMLSGILFRAVSLPLHVYAERLSAERYHVVNTLNYELIKRFSKHYKLNVIASKDGQFLQLETTDKTILQKTNKISKEIILDVCWKHRLQLSRIRYLRLCAISIWTFASFAIRNVVTSNTASDFCGILWFSNLLEPDPYCTIPAFLGALGIFNYFAQRHIYGYNKTKLTRVINACYTLIMVVGVYITSHLPVCIPLFWSAVSFAGSLQYLAFRHPEVKKLLGIRPLPSDTKTPLRDLLFIK